MPSANFCYYDNPNQTEVQVLFSSICFKNIRFFGLLLIRFQNRLFLPIFSKILLFSRFLEKVHKLVILIEFALDHPVVQFPLFCGAFPVKAFKFGMRRNQEEFELFVTQHRLTEITIECFRALEVHHSFAVRRIAHHDALFTRGSKVFRICLFKFDIRSFWWRISLPPSCAEWSPTV